MTHSTISIIAKTLDIYYSGRWGVECVTDYCDYCWMITRFFLLKRYYQRQLVLIYFSRAKSESHKHVNNVTVNYCFLSVEDALLSIIQLLFIILPARCYTYIQFMLHTLHYVIPSCITTYIYANHILNTEVYDANGTFYFITYQQIR